ncbi:deoxyguanosinetriphosphate triphosphohydrolase [Clostridium tarantellae]|uniref:Deoxyguanosinetriphosphate triphosphohydrolase n=1 Tax=Clostridium tarantellae TaxID=39493 RepID=A0A6I1MGC2_9CLOT|nr:deoxyguanosinetriphosphate triphosphohydrolase [Clostridium tarantellae]MPQ42230.1 deoxyguanosinetriphosphate triphosphohydrolase [Clostridium tarantellae]
MKIREKFEEFERLTLNKKATFSVNSIGREKKEELDDIRTCYMVDRDRIIHSKAFRRLKRKTQVFIRTFGDHYRTRLTHTLEVAQIARTIGVGIGLNENLVEAIALGHDLGHVAFAHIGEEVLQEFLPQGFKHNHQSIRVVKKIENKGKGLNLTTEVLDGILKHSGFDKSSAKAITLEGQVVKFADKIAYVNHDIDDSIRAGILSESNIPRDIIKVLGNSNGKRINILVKDCVQITGKNIELGINEVKLSKEIGEALTELRKFMFKNIYLGDFLNEERYKAKFILNHMIEYYYKNPHKMPEFYINICKKEGIHRGIADYIAGMTDDYCINEFNKIYIPKFVIY